MWNPSTKIRRIASLMVFLIPLLTLIICFIITKVRKVYTGGLFWPYFSDMGRDKPSYFVFVTGLTLAAFFTSVSFYFNCLFQRITLRRFQKEQMTTSTRSLRILPCLILVTAFCGIISTIGLPVLSLFDTANYPMIHNLGALWFFSLQFITSIINTVITIKFLRYTKDIVSSTTSTSNDFTRLQTPGGQEDEYKSPMAMAEIRLHEIDRGSSFTVEDVHRCKKTLRIQVACLIVFFCAILFYMPLGELIVDDGPYLTIEDCLRQNLGHKYCNETMKKDQVVTKLRILDRVPGWQVRTVCQVICTLMLLGYSLSFMYHDHESVVKYYHTKQQEKKQQVQVQAQTV